MRRLLLSVTVLSGAALAACCASAADVSIVACGAKTDGTKCTESFRAAVGACVQAGGGRVVVPAGTWYTGPIHLRSNVELHLEKGAKVLFSDDPKDCLPAVPSSWEGLECLNLSPLVYAYGCTNVAITGKGTIRAKMDFWAEQMKEKRTRIQEARAILYKWGSEDYPVEKRDIVAAHPAVLRPQLIQFNRCKGVRIEGVRIEDSPFWTIHLLMSEDVVVRGIDVCAHGFNNDGVDIEMTQNVLVEDSTFDQGDDGFVFKAGRNRDAWRIGRPTRNVEIRNCHVKKAASLVGVGSELSGGIENVYVHDCTADTVNRLYYIKTNHRRGGFVSDVRLENVHVGRTLKVAAVETDVLYQWAVFPDYERRLTAISNLVVRNVRCDFARLGVDVSGCSEMPIQGVALDNVKIDVLEGDLYRCRNVRGMRVKGLSCNRYGPVTTPWDGELGIPGASGLAEGNRPSFFLPSRLYAAPGLECCIYFKDVFDSVVPQNYAFLAVSEVGTCQQERWCWTPDGNDAGKERSVVLQAWQDGVVPVACVTTTVVVADAPADSKRDLTFSVLADSLANCGFPHRVKADMLAAGFANFRPVGARKARTPAEADHDGYGGFTCRAFMTRYALAADEFEHVQDAAERQQLAALGVPVKEVSERQRILMKSPFVHLVDGKKAFDVPWWMGRVNSGKAPDVVVIMLGVNDFFGFGGRPNEIRVRLMEEVMPSFDEFVGKLRAHMPHARIALATLPNGCGQDGFGANYGTWQNEVQHRKNSFVFNRVLQQFVEERGDPLLELLPVAQAVDPVCAFPRASVPANACTSERVERFNNALHATTVGGKQMGDAIAAWLQCRWNSIVGNE